MKNQAFLTSRYWEQTDQLKGADLKWGRQCILEKTGTVWIGFQSAKMAAAGAQLRHKRRKAMDGYPVFGYPLALLPSR